MADTLTAIACPKHGAGCVLSIVTAPKGEVEFPISPESWLVEFAQARPHSRIKELRHDAAAEVTAGLLTGDLITVPRTAEGRIKWLEKRAQRQEIATTDATANAITASAHAKVLEHQLKEQVERFNKHRRHYAVLLREFDGLVLEFEEAQAAIAELEKFVTRKKRWKKAWDRG